MSVPCKLPHRSLGHLVGTKHFPAAAASDQLALAAQSTSLRGRNSQ